MGATDSSRATRMSAAAVAACRCVAAASVAASVAPVWAAEAYVTRDILDVTTLLPPPPQDGTQVAQDELAAVIDIQAHASEARRAQAVADATGASLLVAQAPRAMIDLNRAPHDIDWGMIANAGPPDIRRGGANGSPNSGRARGGLGLVPRRLPGVGELWKAPLTRPELMARIEGVHRPYHACLADTLAALRARWGAALLIVLLSMPPLPVKSVAYSGGRGAGTARVVLGDRFGGSCAGSLVATAFATLAERRMPAAHNRPYAGGFGLERHGAPSRGIHAVQVEVDRSCYLDSRLLELGEGFDVTVALLVDLVRRLAGEVAMLGAGAGGTEGTSRWPFAAE